MRRRASLGLVALVALGLGLYVGMRGGERTGGEAHQPAVRAPEPEPEPVALSVSSSAPESASSSDAQVAREVLTSPATAPAPELSPTWFHARVVDGETDAPLPGAAVFLGIELEPEQEPVTLADAGGRFRFEFDADTPLDSRTNPEWHSPLRIEHEGYGWTLVAAGSGHEEPARAKTVTLLRSAGLRAVILRDGLPASDLRLSVKTLLHNLRQPTLSWWGPQGDDPRWRTTTGADGVAWLEDLPARVPLEVAVFGEDKLLRRLEEPVELEPGEQRDLEIRIGGGCTIRGVAVTPAGTPVSGLAVWMTVARNSEETGYFREEDGLEALSRRTTDAAGTFVIEDVGVGAWYVGLAPGETPGGPLVPLARLVTVEQDDRQKDVELVVHRELFVRGRVLDPDGKPAEGGYVFTESGSGQKTSGGEFELGPVPPGEVRLFALAQWNGMSLHSGAVTANAGDIDVVIALPASAAISGRCVDADGRPRAVHVELRPQEGMLSGVRTRLSTRGPEYFAYSGLPPGLYHVVAIDDLGNFGMLEGIVAKAGEELRDLELVLQPGAKVNVRLEVGQLQPGEPREYLQVRLFQNDIVVAQGAGQRTVPPGVLTAELCAFDPSTQTYRTLESREVSAVIGTEVEVAFYVEEW